MEPSRDIWVVWRFRWWLLIFALAAGGAAYAVSTQLDKTYRATALIRLTPSQQTSGGFLSEVALQQITEGYAELGRSPGTLRRAKTEGDVPPGTSEADLRSAITIDPGGGGVLEVSGEHGDQRTPAAYANATAEALVVEIERSAQRDRQDVLDRIESRVSEIRKSLGSPASSQPEKAALGREFDALQQQAAQVRSRPSDTARLISSARPPTNPESPKPPLNAAIAFLFALLLVGLAVYLRGALRNRYESGAEVAADLGLPLLSEVPRGDSGDPRVREAFRALRTNAEFALSTRGSGNGRGRAEKTGSGGSDAVKPVRTARRHPSTVGDGGNTRPGSVLLVTSPEPGTGKTYVTSNLARALAADGLDVLAVDSDLRRPMLHQRYDLPLSPGLSDVLAKTTDDGNDGLIKSVAPEASHPLAGGSLAALTAGAPLEQSSEALATAQMSHLLDRLCHDHDIIALDSPPVLAAVDASVLARYADGVVLVIDAKRTPRRAARRAVQTLQAVDARLFGVVFNRAPDAGGAYYGYEIATE
jgi:capsular exopolysaccharide synthesis family protein